MKDGVQLSATLYIPDGAKPGKKFPALLEYLPYRKDDGTAAGDYPKHAYFARRGYVSVRVDIRGFWGERWRAAGAGVFRTRTGGWRAGDLVAGSSTVVERERRNVRHFVGRFRCAADGDAACTGVEGDSGGGRHSGAVSR